MTVRPAEIASHPTARRKAGNEKEMKRQYDYPQHFSECCITCTCSNLAPLDEFWREDGEYHCKECGRTWKVEREGKPTTTPSGFVIPAKLRIKYT